MTLQRGTKFGAKMPLLALFTLSAAFTAFTFFSTRANAEDSSNSNQLSSAIAAVDQAFTKVTLVCPNGTDPAEWERLVDTADDVQTTPGAVVFRTFYDPRLPSAEKTKLSNLWSEVTVKLSAPPANTVTRIEIRGPTTTYFGFTRLTLLDTCKSVP